MTTSVILRRGICPDWWWKKQIRKFCSIWFVMVHRTSLCQLTGRVIGIPRQPDNIDGQHKEMKSKMEISQRPYFFSDPKDVFGQETSKGKIILKELIAVIFSFKNMRMMWCSRFTSSRIWFSSMNFRQLSIIYTIRTTFRQTSHKVKSLRKFCWEQKVRKISSCA